MAEFINVVIGIQARSGSKRLPNKVFEKIGERTMIEHVIAAAQTSANFVNYYANKTGLMVTVALLIPEGDQALKRFRNGKMVVIEGSENNVLSRYLKLLDSSRPDYIVRVTGDCPILQPHIITKHIRTGADHRYDYLSNVNEDCRTFPDGWDCEFMSAKFLTHIGDHATEPDDLEHVTTFGRRNPPEWAKVGQVIGYLDMQDVKISIDTEEDLKRVRDNYDRVTTAMRYAEEKYGKSNVHRL